MATEIRAGWGTKMDSEPVEIAPGFEMPTRMRVEVADADGYDAVLILNLVDGRYRCSDLQVSQRPGGPEVTSEALRAIPVARLMREGIPAAAPITENLADLAAEGPTATTLKWVSNVYRLAYASGAAPKQAVADEFEVSSATAGRWIARAREAALLGEAKTPGRATV